jgi:hypothetical protein
MSDLADAPFILKIHTRSVGFGETRAQENNAIAKILTDAAHRVQTGHGPIDLLDNSGKRVAYYSYGVGMRNHPDSGST